MGKSWNTREGGKETVKGKDRHLRESVRWKEAELKGKMKLEGRREAE